VENEVTIPHSDSGARDTRCTDVQLAQSNPPKIATSSFDPPDIFTARKLTVIAVKTM
jgi:hypothetical protein